MTHKPFLLVVDDDSDVLKEIEEFLGDRFEVDGVTTLNEARRILSVEENTEKFSVLVADMRLPGDEKGGLTLARELSMRYKHPEFVVLTAYPDVADANVWMSIGAYGYIEKGKEDTFERLGKACIEASQRWYRRNERVFPPLLEHPVALLCGDIALTSAPELNATDEPETERITKALRDITNHEVFAHRGYVTKWSGDSFAVVFGTVHEAVQAAVAIQRDLTWDVSSQTTPLWQFRAAVHWEQVEQTHIQGREELRGPAVITCIQTLGQTTLGKVVITSPAREVAGAALGFDLHEVEGTDLWEIREPLAGLPALPAWMQFALTVAKDLEEQQVDLPCDLAERHDDYAQGRLTT